MYMVTVSADKHTHLRVLQLFSKVAETYAQLRVLRLLCNIADTRTQLRVKHLTHMHSSKVADTHTQLRVLQLFSEQTHDGFTSITHNSKFQNGSRETLG